MAANLRPTLPECGSAMARDPPRGALCTIEPLVATEIPRGPAQIPMVMPPDDSAESTGGRLVWPPPTSGRSHKRLLSHRWTVQAYPGDGGDDANAPESSACLHNCTALSVGTGLALGRYAASARPGMGQPGDSECSSRTPLRPSLLCRPSQGANRNPDRQPVADSGHNHG